MKHEIDISTFLYLMVIVIIYFLGTSMGMTQEFVNTDNFEKSIAKDIVAIEFWAEWNAANQFNELDKLKDCMVYRVDISDSMEIQMEYDVSAIPTLIVFENGTEQARFLPNIMFKLEADKKLVQHSVDTLILNKFQ
tara:strand:+ start:208 stop:615 length:408 start_codon:yes stop_codon:yes gene_type:complete